MNTNPDWSEIIKTISEHYGWSPARIAEHVGSTQATIWRIASGKQSPRYELGAKLVTLSQQCKQEQAA